jgi:hypothetical protein
MSGSSKEYNRGYYLKHKERLAKVRSKYRKDNREKVSYWAKTANDKRKIECLTYYSKGDVPSCCWDGCDITDIDVLTIDHIVNIGSNRETAGGGTTLHRWLISKGFPEGYQVLCANHNLKKEILRRREVSLYVSGRSNLSERTRDAVAVG